MVTKPKQRLVQILEQIHGGKELHSVEDLSSLAKAIIDFNNQVVSQALITQEIEPHKTEMEGYSDMFEHLIVNLKGYANRHKKEGKALLSLQISDYGFNFIVPANKAKSTMENVALKGATFTRVYSKLESLQEKLCKKIKLEVLPISGETLYLAQGTILIESKDGYHALDIETVHCRDHGPHVLLEELGKTSFRTVDDALNEGGAVMKRGTTAIARGTKDYSLYATAIPVVEAKYEKLLLGRQTATAKNQKHHRNI